MFIVGYWYYYLLGIILLPGIIFSAVAQAKVSSSFNKYKDKPAKINMPANELAKHIVKSSGLDNIKITKCKGSLTDHFNPKTNTVALSEDVYDSNSVAALGIMAHELGHVMQYKDKYPLIKLRSFLVPVINFSSFFMWPLVILGVMFEVAATSSIGKYFIIAAIVIFGLSTLFSLITLPIERDASKRAEQLLYDTGFLSKEETEEVRKVLSSAGLTYVAALITSILSLIRFILYILTITRRND